MWMSESPRLKRTSQEKSLKSSPSLRARGCQHRALERREGKKVVTHWS